MTVSPCKTLMRFRSLVSIDSESAIYRDGSYLKYNPSWHSRNPLSR